MQDISDCLSPEARNVAEARLAAKRAARAEAREIRMKELERQQKEASDEDDVMSVTSRSSLRVEERPDKDFAEKDSLAEVEEKYKRSMVTNAQLDNEKSSLQYQVDTLREVLLELEEELAESRRQYEDKQKECERQKHEQNVLRFQLAEMKEALEQREALMTKHGIPLDSDGALNGDTSIEHHVNSDGPPDPPVRAVSMGKTEGTVEKMETMSVVGECPPSVPDQDRQEIAQEAQEEIQLHAEGGDVTSDRDEKENDSSTDMETQPVDVCSHQKAETHIDEQTEEVYCDIREDAQEISKTSARENFSEVDGEATSKQSDVSPSGSEEFQDAIDFDEETSSRINECHEDVTKCVSNCEKDEQGHIQQENMTGDQCTMAGAPEDGAENTVHVCKNDEGEQDSNKAIYSPEDSSTEFSEEITSDKNGDVEDEAPAEEKIGPQQQSLQEESQTIEENVGHNTNDETLSTAENSGDMEETKVVSAPEQPSQEAILTCDLAEQVESEKDKISDVSESCIVTERNNITEENLVKDQLISEESDGQNEQKPVPEDENKGDISVQSEAVQQREDDLPPHDMAPDNIQNAEDAMSNQVESPKEILPPEALSSEGESTQEGDETDEEDDDKDNGTIRSEKYTGESELPCTSLGSSVDGQSLEDIRMEDASDKSPRRGKGKNKEDCVVS